MTKTYAMSPELRERLSALLADYGQHIRTASGATGDQVETDFNALAMVVADAMASPNIFQEVPEQEQDRARLTAVGQGLGAILACDFCCPFHAAEQLRATVNKAMEVAIEHAAFYGEADASDLSTCKPQGTA